MSKSANPLGELELQVMELLWKEGEMTVRQLWSKQEFGQRAYTTMMTTMDRLYRKGLLRRKTEKNAYCYWPTQDRASYWQSVSQELMLELMKIGGAPTLTAFVDAARDQDEENLTRLETMIRQRQKERKKQDTASEESM